MLLSWIRPAFVRLFLVTAVAGLVMAFASSARGQSSDSPPSSTAPSLGDLARKQRAKQQDAQAKDAKPKKVVTDEDMPEHPADSTDSVATNDDEPHADAEATPASTVERTGDQRKAAISKQKKAIADLKAKIDKAQSTVHYVEANAYRNGVEYNKAQAQKQAGLERAQGQLAEMQKNLEKMQEDARKAGFASAVWDP